MTAAAFSVSFDLTPIELQIVEAKRLLERIPDDEREQCVRHISFLVGFGLKTEVLPADTTGRYVLRIRSDFLSMFVEEVGRALERREKVPLESPLKN